VNEVRMTTARLLVVEDDQDTLDLLTLWLSENYRVFSYGCASDALAALDMAKPDLLLLDIGMGPIDGLACLEAIRAIPGYRSIPAIALTGYARASEREAFRAAGFQAVLAKPILDDELCAAITAVLASWGSQRSDRSSATTVA
jgi:CheY-like chemotaxis protein